MRRLIFVLLTLIGSNARAGAFVNQFVQVRPGQRLWVEYRQAEHGRPTLFLMNGLTYSTKQWHDFVAALDKLDPDLGLVLYDMEGMGQTLLDKAPITFDIPFDSQLADFKDLFTTLNIQGPKFLAGLSYGGGLAVKYLAAHPDDFDQVIAMAPFLSPLPDQDTYIKNMVAWTRMTFPFDRRTDDEIYDYYLHQLIYATYPAAEPIVLENPYKLEGIYRMVKGSKNWNVANVINSFPAGKLNLMAGTKDQYIALSLQQNFWAAVPEASRASFLIIPGASHKMPEVIPDYAAQWIMQILNRNPAMAQGLTFTGSLLHDNATSGGVVIPLKPKVSACADTLRRISATR